MLFHDLITRGLTASKTGDALRLGTKVLTYAALQARVEAAARGLHRGGVRRGDRVAVWLPKSFEAVVALFAIARMGAVFVPVNPVLKPGQVVHILDDSGAACLVTSADRLAALPDDARSKLTLAVTVEEAASPLHAVSWSDIVAQEHDIPLEGPQSETELAALLYTSGSTGLPKGVMLSHRNLTLGAESVAAYLNNRPDDRLLCALPLSFDYGLSQITTAFFAGAQAVLINHLFPRDILNVLARDRITGLGCVPPLWHQLLALDWPPEITQSLRYVTNSGGHLPQPAVDALQATLPQTDIVLMYGLTEAFRSTYLPPDKLTAKPGSMGIPIPHAQINVVTEDGRPAAPGVHGELVHSGPLVAQGYWRDEKRTAERFRPLPAFFGVTDPAVWSGDTVYRDEDGFFYFVERRGAMIKTSGYRVSPTEIETALFQIDGVAEAAAIGVPHTDLGQAIVAVVVAESDEELLSDEVLMSCRTLLPAFMAPKVVVIRDVLPRNPNGKIDRTALAGEFAGLFAPLSQEMGR